jgi:hypothetical protein
MFRQNMGEQFRLVIELAARHRAIDAIEVSGKLQMVQNAACEIALFDVAR